MLPLPLVGGVRPRTRPADAPAPVVEAAVLGFYYPGNGHDDVAEALRSITDEPLPRRLTVLGAASTAAGLAVEECDERFSTVEATETGYRRLLAWACRLGEPVFGIEGCGSYGAGLARFLADRGVAVYECERPKRGERRGDKNDLIDAALAARRVVTGEGLSLPRGDGRREQLRVLLLERRGAARARTAALNQLDAVIVTAPDDLRRRLTGLPKKRLVASAARLRSRHYKARGSRA